MAHNLWRAVEPVTRRQRVFSNLLELWRSEDIFSCFSLESLLNLTDQFAGVCHIKKTQQLSSSALRPCWEFMPLDGFCIVTLFADFFFFFSVKCPRNCWISSRRQNFLLEWISVEQYDAIARSAVFFGLKKKSLYLPRIYGKLIPLKIAKKNYKQLGGMDKFIYLSEVWSRP